MPTFTKGTPGWGVTETAKIPGLPRADDEQIDVSIRKLKLVGELHQAGIDVDVTQVITDGKLEDSMSGAPQFTLNILDRDYAALQSGVFGQKVDIELDAVPFRLVEVSVTDVEMLELLFEHKLVNLLREHRSPLKANRGTTTRAQFVERLLREITNDMAVTFVSPQEDQVQPIGSAKASGRTLKAKKLSGTTLNSLNQAARQPGFGTHSLNVRSWDGSTLHLGPIELGNMGTVLGVCKQLNAPAKAVLAAVEACIVEDNCRNSSVATDHTSTGILQVLASTARGLGVDPLDVAGVTNAFLTKGFTGSGSAISLARTNPGRSAGWIAQSVQGSAYGSRYDAAQSGALAIIRAWAGGTGFASSAFSSFASAGRTIVTNVPYEFSRGQPGQKEDSWTCMQRLATEVNWRCFVAGRNSLYFVTDDDLLVTQSKYTIGPGDQGVVKFTMHAEVGGRTILRKGKRQPKPSEILIDVRIDRWAAPPGSVATIEDYGVGDGDWLVFDIQRALFDAAGQVTLHAPQTALPEPAPQTKTTSIPGTAGAGSVPGLGAGLSGSSNPVTRVYVASQAMSARHLPYGAAGHTGNWATALRAPSQDCSSSVSIVLYQAGLMNSYPGPIVSGDFLSWGAAGKGSQMTVWVLPGSGPNGHVFIEFYGRPAQRFDTVGGGNGPQIRFGLNSWEATGFAARHFPGL